MTFSKQTARAYMQLREAETNTEQLRKKRIGAMTLLELQIRVIFLEGFIAGATGKVPPSSPT